jgi:hypothetical protein
LRLQSNKNSPPSPDFTRARKPLEFTQQGLDTPVSNDLETAPLDNDTAVSEESPKASESVESLTVSTPDAIPESHVHFVPIPPAHVQFVHFTVRIIMCKRKESCKQILERFHTTWLSEPKGIWWTGEATDNGLWEDKASDWENWMFRQWIKREEEHFPDPTDNPDPTNKRFTHSLKSHRSEGWSKPPRLQYDGGNVLDKPHRTEPDQSLELKPRHRQRSGRDERRKTSTRNSGVRYPIRKTEDESIKSEAGRKKKQKKGKQRGSISPRRGEPATRREG